MLVGLPLDEAFSVALVVAVGEPGGVLLVLSAPAAPAAARPLHAADLDPALAGKLLDLGGRDLGHHLVGDLEAAGLGRGPKLVDRLLGDVADARGRQVLALVVSTGRRRGAFVGILGLFLLVVLGRLGARPQGCRERRHAELGVGPGEEGAVRGVVGHLLEPRDLHEPLREVLVEPDVAGVDRLRRPRGIGPLSVGRLGEVVVPPVDQYHRDVLVSEDVLEERQALGLGDLVGPRPVGVLLVAVHEVHVETHAADGVLVEVAIAVVVDPLDHERVLGPLALVAIGLDVEPRLAGIAHEIGLLEVEDAHHRDHPVAVEVVGRVLVHDSVAILVIGPQVAAPRLADRGEVALGGVGVDARHHVDGVVRQERLRRLVAGLGLRDQQLGHREGHAASDEVIAVEVGDQEQRRPLVGLDPSAAGQTQGPDRPALAAGADRLHAAEPGVVGGEPVDARRELGVRQVPRFRSLCGGGRPRPRTPRCDQERGERRLGSFGHGLFPSSGDLMVVVMLHGEPPQAEGRALTQIHSVRWSPRGRPAGRRPGYLR